LQEAIGANIQKIMRLLFYGPCTGVGGSLLLYYVIHIGL
jgi:hypothetical protein